MTMESLEIVDPEVCLYSGMMTDSDEEYYQRQYRMETIERWQDFDFSVIYDIRGKRSVVKGQLLKSHLRAELKRVPQECLRMDRKDGSIVIHDNNEGDMILYISDNEMDLQRHTHRHHAVRRCIGITGTNTILDLHTILTKAYGNRDICLFFKDKRLDDTSAQLSSVLKTGSRVVCRTRKKEDFHCFYKPRANVEQRYTINCWNTDSISTIINMFHETFTDEFDGLSNGKSKVWFTRGKTMLKDDEFPCLDINKSGRIQGKIFVQVCPVGSFPVTIQVMGKNTENNCHLMFISLPMSSKYFRQEISILTNIEPNAIQLRLTKKKLRCATLTEDEGLQENCTVLVTAKPKLLLLCKIKVNSRSYRGGINIFKLDSILQAKQQMAIQMKNHVGDVDVRDMQVMFQGVVLNDEDTLFDHRIRDGDSVNIHIFHDAIHLILRQPGQMRKCLTINNHHQCTVKDIKSHMAQCYRCSILDLEIIFRERCLCDDEQLENLLLNSGDHILVTKAVETRKMSATPVFICGTDETMPVILAVNVGGKVFTAIDAISLDEFRRSDETDRRSATTGHAMILRNAHISDEPLPRPPTSTQLLPITKMSLDEERQPSKVQLSEENARENEQPTDEKRLVKGKTLHSKVPSLHSSVSAPALSDRIMGYRSDPETNTIKRFTLSKELRECAGRYIFREQACYEEDVSHKSAHERFESSSPINLRSPDSVISVGSPDTMPMLTQGKFEPHSTTIQESVLHAVALEIGQDWKRLALDLSLKKADIDDIEYQHSRSLRAQAFEALIRWRRRESRNATLERLKQSLHNIEQSIIADSIEENIKYETN